MIYRDLTEHYEVGKIKGDLITDTIFLAGL